MARSCLLAVCAAAILAACAADAGQGICYATARSYKKFSVSKVGGRYVGRSWVTGHYTQYREKPIVTRVKICCPGYRQGSKGTCVPVCNPSCPEPKVCAGPNRCLCPSHLAQDGGGRCVEPLCLNRTCQHGYCNPTSGTCVCDAGYRWRGDREDGRCEPECPGGCVGGRCSAPNVCECEGGWRRAAAGCEPESCPPGYELKPNATLGVRMCQPVCPSGCPYGRCSAPDTCECDEGFQPGQREDGAATCHCRRGYRLAVGDGGLHECRPDCGDACGPHADCVAPSTCQCVWGYRLAEGDGGPPECRPDCGDACGPHADCVAPGTCHCVRGYREERSNAELEQNAPIRCSPACAFSCGGGKCVAPNECQCAYSFQWWRFYRCHNASCRWHNQCSCRPGYEWLPGNGSVCVPRCDPPCGNGTCVAPGRCSCWEGYELSGGRCVPKCSSNCGYGSCAAPEHCECWSGYELATDGTGPARCVPACRPPCEHGDCVAPDRCECWRGYRSEGPACLPVCAQPCDNGDCVGPDTCLCRQGFARVPGDETGWACRPVCNATCVNATCTAPDTCTCLEGLVRDSGDPTGARCGPPCPEHLCTEGRPGDPGCLAATEDPGCVCATGRRRAPCKASTTHQGRHIAWPLLLLLLIPGLATLALLVYLHIRNRRKKSGDEPPQQLSTTTSEGSSPKHSVSDEYDDATSVAPVDTKKLIKCSTKRRNLKASSSHVQNGDPTGGLYEPIGGDRQSHTYGEVAYSEIGISSVLHDGKLKPNSAVEDGDQMAENDFYGDPAGSEWCRASVHQVANDLYGRPQGNASARVDLDVMYARVVKKGDRCSTAKMVDSDFSSQLCRQENSSTSATPNGTASAALCQKSALHQTDCHYEEVSDRSERPTELRESQEERRTTQREEQQYEEIGDVPSKRSTEMVDNDLYRECDSGIVHQEGHVVYEEIGNEGNRGVGEMVENNLYGQR